jgi:hypothetical protein
MVNKNLMYCQVYPQGDILCLSFVVNRYLSFLFRRRNRYGAFLFYRQNKNEIICMYRYKTMQVLSSRSCVEL